MTEASWNAAARKNIDEMKAGDRVVADTHWTKDRYQSGEIVSVSAPGWVNFRNDADGHVWATDPSNVRVLPQKEADSNE